MNSVCEKLRIALNVSDKNMCDKLDIQNFTTMKK